jgi:hypothetical protein
MFQAGFDNLARQVLSDCDSLRDATAFRHQTRDVRTGGHKTTLVERFQVQASGWLLRPLRSLVAGRVMFSCVSHP